MADDTPTPETPETPEPQSREPEAVKFDPAEFQRQIQEQFARQERTLAALAQAVTQVQAPPASAQPQPEDLKDDELWALAQQGNREAFRLLQERTADRRIEQKLRVKDTEQSVGQQLAILYNKYPELAQPDHPLRHRAIAFKQALVNLGHQNSRATDLEAILRAVADSRDVLTPKTAIPARTSSAGQMGASHRQEPTGEKADEPKLTPEDFKLAKHYGVKDPKKSVEKFWKRQEDGRSQVSPTIASALDRSA